MKKFEKILKKIFCLPPILTAAIAAPSFIFVFVMLYVGNNSALSYISYALSAYATIIAATGFPKIVRAMRDSFKETAVMKKIRGNPIYNKLLEDFIFRSELSLHGGLSMNILYSALNLFSGIRFRSAWFFFLFFYYIMLSVMRVALVRYVHRSRIGQDIPSEFRRYRSCGILILLMNQALIGIVIYIVCQNRGFDYPGLLIYTMALYTFYITITAIVNVIRYRKHGSPVLSASKAISLTAAMVSMLSLETAMISRFGADQPDFRRIMTSASGGCVCIIVLGMALYMIIKSTKRLKELESSDSRS